MIVWEDKREDYQNCSVLCCVWQPDIFTSTFQSVPETFIRRYAHTYEQFLILTLRLGFL